MILCADVGNTNVTLGLFDAGRLAAQWRLETDSRRTADEYGLQLLGCLRHEGASSGNISGFALGSVVPTLTPVFEDLARRYFGLEALVVSHRSRLGLKLKVDRPEEVGADRILNALAAWRMRRGAAIVIDFGTATTFDCVSKRAEYLGGAILIGPGLAARALSAGTAQLPEVPVRSTGRVIGKNTLECLQAGLYHGYLGMIERVLRGSLREMGGKPAVIATGGLAGLYAGALGLETVPDLTLQGLRLAYEISGS